MAHRCIQAHGGRLPDYVIIAFCNTGKEREKTLVFVNTFSRHYDVPVTWLEYDYIPDAGGGRRDPRHLARVVTFETASRNGEPFSRLNETSGFLPNRFRRKCTRELKTNTLRRHILRTYGIDSEYYKCVIGFRGDEEDRAETHLFSNCNVIFPMILDGTTKEDVQKFWARAPFDLGFSSDRGNCDLCPLKGEANLLETIQDEPHLCDWWIHEEDKANERRGQTEKKPIQFSDRYSYRQLREKALSGHKASDSEDARGLSCMCTD